MPSEFGGVPVDEPAPPSEFGGVPAKAPSATGGLAPHASLADELTMGATSGMAHTVLGVYDLLRKIPGAEKILPEVHPAVRLLAEPPTTAAGKAGRLLEQTAEFSVPAGAVSEAIKGAPLAARIAAEGLTAGGITAAQTEGNPGATAAGTVLGAAGPAIGGAVEALGAGELPKKLYQSALKPSLAKTAPTPASIVMTGLKEGIPVSAEGFFRSAAKIDEINNRITQRLGEITQNAGATINPADVAARVGQITPKFANQVNPEADLAALERSKEEFLRTQPDQMTASKAQALKQGTYRNLGTKAYTGELKAADVEAQKALARGLKEEIENVFPEIKGLNAREGALIDLQGALERYIKREGNHQITGIGTPIMATAAAAASGHPGVGMAAGALRAALEMPQIKSRIAIALAQAAKAPATGNNGALIRSAVEAGISSHAQPNAMPVPQPAQ